MDIIVLRLTTLFGSQKLMNWMIYKQVTSTQSVYSDKEQLPSKEVHH